ncbi:MAG: squalene/phytoene synthase family protein [Rhodobacteraceae bacterium]|nr:squalene/phytoene synthase family protein [Paracoccaceae bacterium]
MVFDADLTACARIVERGDPERFVACMSLPVAARAQLFPLFAFNVEVARAPWVTQEPMIAKMRLQWWIDALEEIAGGGPVRRHEVVTPLAARLSPDQARLLITMVEARDWDTESDPFPDEAAFRAYLDATSGHVLWVGAQMMGAAPDSEPGLRRVALAIGLANWMRAIPTLEEKGKRPLVDGRAEAVASLAREGQLALRAGRSLSRAARQVLVTGWAARDVLAAIVADPGLVARGAIPEPRRFAFHRAALTGRI